MLLNFFMSPPLILPLFLNFLPFPNVLFSSLVSLLLLQVTDLREVLSYMDSMEAKIRAAQSLCDQTMQVGDHMMCHVTVT